METAEKHKKDFFNDQSLVILDKYFQKNIEEYAIQFAKKHVEAALQKAAYQATLGYDDFGKMYFVDRKSILDAYPLENIK